MSKFPIRVDPLWAAPMLLIGVHGSTAYLEIGDTELTLKFGFAHETFPFADLGPPVETEWSMINGLGVRFGPDGIGYVGSTHGVVFMPLKKPKALKVLLNLTHEVDGFYASLEDPAAFIAALRAKIL